MQKKIVQFTAHENVREPARISFPTKNGYVSFVGHKTVKEPVQVKFEAKIKP
jgi:hypothetical protein